MDKMILKAARYANQMHDGQKRKYTDKPYITHPARIAGRVMVHPIVLDASVEDGSSIIAAAWLHDVVEDCGVSYETLRYEGFSDLTIDLIQALTNPSKDSPLQSRKFRKQLDREHYAVASREAKVLKLIDRLDNVGELAPYAPLDFIKLYRDETHELVKVLLDADEGLAIEVLKTIDEAVEIAERCGFGER